MKFSSLHSSWTRLLVPEQQSNFEHRNRGAGPEQAGAIAGSAVRHWHPCMPSGRHAHRVCPLFPQHVTRCIMHLPQHCAGGEPQEEDALAHACSGAWNGCHSC